MLSLTHLNTDKKNVHFVPQMKKIARRQQQQQQQQQEQEQLGGSRRGPSRGGRQSNDDSEGKSCRLCQSKFRKNELESPRIWLTIMIANSIKETFISA